MLSEEYLENLDGQTQEELMAYAERLNELNLPVASEDAHVRDKLARYASHKAYAMKCRAQGIIASAMQLEAGCDAIYKSLPDWAKW